MIQSRVAFSHTSVSSGTKQATWRCQVRNKTRRLLIGKPNWPITRGKKIAPDVIALKLQMVSFISFSARVCLTNQHIMRIFPTMPPSFPRSCTLSNSLFSNVWLPYRDQCQIYSQSVGQAMYRSGKPTGCVCLCMCVWMCVLHVLLRNSSSFLCHSPHGNYPKSHASFAYFYVVNPSLITKMKLI